MNTNTIKSEVRKTDKTIKIIEVKKHNWGLFTVKVKKEMKRSTKIGLIFGEWNSGDVKLEKIEWIQSRK